MAPDLPKPQGHPFHRELNRRLSFYKASCAYKVLSSPKRMIYSKVLDVVSKRFNVAVVTTAKTFFRDNMRVVLPEGVSIAIYRYGFYEEGLTTFILTFLKPGMIFFDIGAHFGLFTLLASHIVGSSGQVHSFEPTRSTFEILKENVRGRDNVYLNNRAVWSRDGVISFNDYGLKFSARNSAYDPRLSDRQRDTVRRNTYQVDALSIDQYIDKMGLAPHFVKIDAEGAEYEILRGMQRTLRDFGPIVTIEVGDMDIEGVVPSREVVEYVLDKGYQALEFKDGEIQKHVVGDRYTDDNLFFVQQ